MAAPRRLKGKPARVCILLTHFHKPAGLMTVHDRRPATSAGHDDVIWSKIYGLVIDVGVMGEGCKHRAV